MFCRLSEKLNLAAILSETPLQELLGKNGNYINERLNSWNAKQRNTCDMGLSGRHFTVYACLTMVETVHWDTVCNMLF